MAQDRAEHLNPALMRFDNDLSDLRKTDKSNLAGKAYDNFGMDDDGVCEFTFGTSSSW